MKKIAIAHAMAAAGLAGAFEPRRVRAYTQDEMLRQLSRRTIDSAGAFLVGELERLDQTLNMPLVDVTWGRDIDLRSDVSIADELSSFTNSDFAAAGGASPNGKSWIGKDSNAIAGVALDIKKTAQPLNLWGMEVGWTIPELESAQRLGRPVDSQKVDGMELKRQMDIDEMVYIGDPVVGATGLINNTGVDLANATSGLWTNPATTPDAILAEVNAILTRAWKNSGYKMAPRRLGLPPVQFGALVSRKVSDAGNISVLEYVKLNCISMAKNGVPLEIVPVKWLEGAGTAGANRMIAYTKDQKFVRYPLTAVQRTPLEYKSIYQLTTYFCRLGQVEFVYLETAAYTDGI